MQWLHELSTIILTPNMSNWGLGEVERPPQDHSASKRQTRTGMRTQATCFQSGYSFHWIRMSGIQRKFRLAWRKDLLCGLSQELNKIKANENSWLAPLALQSTPQPAGRGPCIGINCAGMEALSSAILLISAVVFESLFWVFLPYALFKKNNIK